MKKFLPILIISLVLLGAGCQKQTRVTTNKTISTVNVSTINSIVANTTTSANVIASCSLVTKDEAESTFGQTAQEPELKGMTCRYDTVGKTKFFDLTAKTGTRKDFDNVCAGLVQPVDGLGDTSCSGNNTVIVLKNGVLMTMIAGGVFNQDQLQDLAVKAVSRIL